MIVKLKRKDGDEVSLEASENAVNIWHKRASATKPKLTRVPEAQWVEGDADKHIDFLIEQYCEEGYMDTTELEAQKILVNWSFVGVVEKEMLPSDLAAKATTEDGFLYVPLADENTMLLRTTASGRIPMASGSVTKLESLVNLFRVRQALDAQGMEPVELVRVHDDGEGIQNIDETSAPDIWPSIRQPLMEAGVLLDLTLGKECAAGGLDWF